MKRIWKDRWMISESTTLRALIAVPLGAIALFSPLGCAVVGGGLQETGAEAQQEDDRWQIGTPIVGYYHGLGGGGGRWDPLTDGMARKLVDAVSAWGSSLEDLDVAHAHGLRVTLHA